LAWGAWNQPAINIPLAVGLWLASAQPMQQRTILVTALTAKVFALALGFQWHDAVWLPVLAWLLHRDLVNNHAVDSVIRGSSLGSMEGVFEGIRTEDGIPLNRLVRSQPTLLVFLRHAGCPFCRQALADLAKAKDSLRDMGVQIALIHHSSEDAFSWKDLAGIHKVRDADRRLYRHFGLGRGGFIHILGPSALLQGAWAVLKERHLIGIPDGDLFQMPGVFLVENHNVLASYYHRVIGDRPDYVAICSTALKSFQPR